MRRLNHLSVTFLGISRLKFVSSAGNRNSKSGRPSSLRVLEQIDLKLVSTATDSLHKHNGKNVVRLKTSFFYSIFKNLSGNQE